jgi:2-methylcitrate dehydratase
MRGVTGPSEVFEGNKGFMDSIAGPFEIDWAHEDLERVRRTIIKKHNAEIHSQPAVEAALETQATHGFRGADVARIAIDTFDVAYHIIGGGEEGDKTAVRTKEEADHSLPYMVAVALLDGSLTPEQYEPDRIRREDVQGLLRKVIVRPLDAYSARFPEEMPCRLTITLRDGTTLVKEKRDYEGFHTRPMSWDRVRAKFEGLAEPYADARLRDDVVAAVATLETIQIWELTELLGQVELADS